MYAKSVLKHLLAVFILGLSCVSAYGNTLRNDLLFQVALLQSLIQGEYDGIVTVGELKQYGDTGIGTFKGVNGEFQFRTEYLSWTSSVSSQ